MSFDLNSWPLKFALMAALLGTRQLIIAFTPRPERGRPNETLKSIVETIDSIAMAIGLVLFVIQPFLLQAFYIPSSSMEDTLQISDRLLVSKLIYRLHPPQFQDVVVFRAPPEATQGTEMASESDTDFIKRCIGTPGDIVFVKNSTIFRQPRGATAPVALSEPYLKPPPPMRPTMAYEMKIVGGEVYERDLEFGGQFGLWMCKSSVVPLERQAAITDAAPEAVTEGHLLMMGDNRNNSKDSHIWGLLKRDAVVGKAICVFWPLPRWGMVRAKSLLPPVPPRSAKTAAAH